MNLAYLPEQMKLLKPHLEAYDVVVTDPPYADDGMLMFVYAATILLRLGGRIHLSVPHLFAESWTDDLIRLVESQVLRLGFVIDQLIPSFGTYNESDVLSSLMVCTKIKNIPIQTVLRKARRLALKRFYTTREPVQLHG